MTFVRHRDRMVQESVVEDLQNTLIACRWMAGTTSRPVISPYAPPGPPTWQIVTTTPAQVLKMVGAYPVEISDSFPETEDPDRGVVGDPDASHVRPNTLAIDDPQAGDSIPMELGSTLAEVPYRFTLAFYGSNISVSQALFNDLRDRYMGRIVGPDKIDLYDYNTDPSVSVVRMEVESFSYARDVEEVAPFETTLFFGQLIVSDQVD